jgi:hypothetical protein
MPDHIITNLPGDQKRVETNQVFIISIRRRSAKKMAGAVNEQGFL